MAGNRELRLGLQRAHGTLARSWWGWDARKSEPLLVSVALTVSLHAVAFSVPVRGQQTRTEVLHASVAPHAVRVRTLPASTATSVDPDRGTSAGHAHLAAPASGDLHREPRIPALTGRELGVSTSADNGSVSPVVSGLALRIPGALSDEDFFARDALDVGPSAAAPVLIDYPSLPGSAGTHVGLLSLFIDESGKVVRVRVDSQSLPPEMQDAARSAFMVAAFSPGLVDGLPVRSKIRVEVTFESGSAQR